MPSAKYWTFLFCVQCLQEGRSPLHHAVLTADTELFEILASVGVKTLFKANVYAAANKKLVCSEFFCTYFASERSVIEHSLSTEGSPHAHKTHTLVFLVSRRIIAR